MKYFFFVIAVYEDSLYGDPFDGDNLGSQSKGDSTFLQTTASYSQLVLITSMKAKGEGFSRSTKEFTVMKKLGQHKNLTYLTHKTVMLRSANFALLTFKSFAGIMKEDIFISMVNNWS